MSDPDDSDIPKVKILWGDYEWEKYGEILKNRTSKKLLAVLNEGIPYIKNDLAKLAGIDFNKVDYHLKKFRAIGLATLGTKTITEGGKPHATFTNDIDLVGIFIKKMGTTTVDDNLVRRFFKDSVKFASVVFTGIITYFGLKSSYIKTEIDIDSVIISDDLSDIPTKSDITTFIEHTYEIDFFVVYLVTLIVISTNLFIIWFTKKFK